MTDSDDKKQRALKAILDETAPPCITRGQQVARFKLLLDVEGLTNIDRARLCNVSQATIKRWKRCGPKGPAVDLRTKRGKAQQGRPGAPPPSRSSSASATSARERAWEPENGHLTAADLLGGESEVAGFDAILALKRIACHSTTPRPLKVSALRIIAQHENQKGRIPWENIKVDQIPTEVQHRLAGALLHLVRLDELPEQVKLASPQRRRVFRLLGLLPPSDAVAGQVLERYNALAVELRAQLAPEALAVERPPLKISLAVQSTAASKG